MRCLRCRKEILSETQTCFFMGQWGSMRWKCVPEDDKTVIKVDGLNIKTGHDVPPVPILEDPYGEVT